MPKAYWITWYMEIGDSSKLADYARLAGPAIEAGGGRFLARGMPVASLEQGTAGRTVLIEFDSVDQAIATYNSQAYAIAVKALGPTAVRRVRIVAGLDG